MTLVGGTKLKKVGEYVKSFLRIVWSKASRRGLAGATFLILITLFIILLQSSRLGAPFLASLPNIPVDHKLDVPSSLYNESKVALLIEDRVNPILSPLLVHFMSVVPADWRFRFMGSEASVAFVNESRAIRTAVEMGKLDLTYIPPNMTTGSQEEISRTLTNLWFYETVLQPAEWLLVFQTDSMLCANSRQSLNSWLEYDWVGAPWDTNGQFGGNGGLSLRRVSRIIDVLKHHERAPGTQPEDVWLTTFLAQREGAHLANGTVSLTFSGEVHKGEGEKISAPGAPYKQGQVAGELVKGIDDWREDQYEPMGYHTGGGGAWLWGEIWGSPELRKHIWNYCPEIKMILAMDAAQYVPGSCNQKAKRSFDGWSSNELEPETEILDGIEYPLLSSRLRAW